MGFTYIYGHENAKAGDKISFIEKSALTQANSRVAELEKELSELRQALRNRIDNYERPLEKCLEVAIQGLELMNCGPAKTMAEPWSVWYSEHSGKALTEIRKLKGAK